MYKIYFCNLLLLNTKEQDRNKPNSHLRKVSKLGHELIYGKATVWYVLK